MSAPRVLVVDDSPFALHWCKSVLAPRGMEVSTLDNPLLMLKSVRDFSPDVLILGVNMPGIDAEALVDIVPIVLHSDLPAAQLEAIAARCGAEWVRKGSNPRPLFETLDRVLKANRKVRVVAVDD